MLPDRHWLSHPIVGGHAMGVILCRTTMNFYNVFHKFTLSTCLYCALNAVALIAVAANDKSQSAGWVRHAFFLLSIRRVTLSTTDPPLNSLCVDMEALCKEFLQNQPGLVNSQNMRR